VPVKLIIIIAAATAAVGIAVAVIASSQNTSANEQGDRFNVRTVSPDAVTMARGETRVIPLQMDIISQQPSDAMIWVYSTDSPSAGAAGSGSPEQRFQEMKQMGLAPGFTGSIDEEEFGVPASPQEPATSTVNFTLEAAGDMEPGSYYFVHAAFIKSGANDYVSQGTFAVTVTP
jgi:hypothetical protein